MQKKDNTYNTLWKRAKRLQQKTEAVQSDVELSDVDAETSSDMQPFQKRMCMKQLPMQQHELDSDREQNDCSPSNFDNNSSESSSEEEPSFSPTLNDRLAQWASEFQIKHNAVDSLLNVLRESGHPLLPKTARTLLATCDKVDFVVKSGMQYIYLGCKEQLVKNLELYPRSLLSQIDELGISLNVDGLPLFKSCSRSLWPVLCKINLSPPTVFPFALCYGASKPRLFGRCCQGS